MHRNALMKMSCCCGKTRKQTNIGIHFLKDFDSGMSFNTCVVVCKHHIHLTAIPPSMCRSHLQYLQHAKALKSWKLARKNQQFFSKSVSPHKQPSTTKFSQTLQKKNNNSRSSYCGWASEILHHQTDGWNLRIEMGFCPSINWCFGFRWPIHSTFTHLICTHYFFIHWPETCGHFGMIPPYKSHVSSEVIVRYIIYADHPRYMVGLIPAYENPSPWTSPTMSIGTLW